MQPNPDSPFLTLAEAAAYTRMSERYLEGSNVPRIRKGSRVVYDRVQLDAWMRADLTHAVGGQEKAA
jgi:hypothetical protein